MNAPIFPALTGQVRALSADTATIGDAVVRIGAHLHDYLALCKGRSHPVRVLVRDGVAWHVARAEEG